MKLLLDTHLLVWSALAPERISKSLQSEMEDSQNELIFSAASLWEIVIKRGRDRPDFQIDPHVLKRNLLDNGYEELPVTGDHALAVIALPAIHKDPFDRILIAQAIAEGITLLTVDAVVARYPGPVRMV